MNEKQKEYIVKLLEKFSNGYSNGTFLEVCGINEKMYEQVSGFFHTCYVLFPDQGHIDGYVSNPKNKKFIALCGNHKKIPMDKYNVVYFDSDSFNEEGLREYTKEILKKNISTEPFVFLYSNFSGNVLSFIDEYYGPIGVGLVNNSLIAVGVDSAMKKKLTK